RRQCPRRRSLNASPRPYRRSTSLPPSKPLEVSSPATLGPRMRAPAALLATFLALLGQLGTGDAQSSADARSPTPSASSVRLVPPLDGSEIATLGVESDGT